MGLKKVGRMGSVTIRLNSRDGFYYLAFWSKALEKQLNETAGVRATTARQLAGKSIPEEVKQLARQKHEQLNSTAGKHLLAVTNPTLPEALDAAFVRCRANTEGRRKDLYRFGRYFLDFMGKTYPAVSYWADVKPSHLSAFVDFHGKKEHNGKRKVSPKSLKHYTGAISQVAQYWANENPDLFRPLVANSRYLAERRKTAKHYLTGSQLEYLCELANELNEPMALAAVMFGGYAGMNLLEIVRLSDSSFNFVGNTVSITDSKTLFRERTLPMLPRVVEFARHFVPKQGKGWLITKQDGTQGTNLTLSRPLRRLLDTAAKRTGEQAYADADPKDMRKSFANLLKSAGVSESATGGYLGHRPTTITARAYADYGEIAYLQREVVAPVEAYLQALKPAANVVAIA